MNKTCCIFALYNEYKNYDLTITFIRSFQSVFGKDYPLIAIDNHKLQPELEFLHKNNVKVLDNPNTVKSHGIGMDVGCEYARKNGFENVILLEPDCIIQNDVWYNDILRKLNEGYHNAGSVTLSHGPIHLCGAGWKLDKIPFSFEVAERTSQEIFSNEYRKLIDCAKLVQLPDGVDYTTEHLHFLMYYWDCGIKNWFYAAKNGKAVKTDGNGFHHLWMSRFWDLKTRLKSFQRGILTPYITKEDFPQLEEKYISGKSIKFL